MKFKSFVVVDLVVSHYEWMHWFDVSKHGDKYGGHDKHGCQMRIMKMYM